MLRSYSWCSLAPYALLSAALLLSPACSDEEVKAKDGEACKVDADCDTSLVCRASVCTSVKSNNPNNNNGDMSPDMVVDMTPMVMPERYYISFINRSEFGEDKDKKFLFILDTQDNVVVKASDNDLLCSLSCWPSRDLKSLVYLRRSTKGDGTFDVFIAPIDASLKVQGEGSAAVESAESVNVVGETISFIRTENGIKKGYQLKIGAAQEKLVAELGSATATPGSIFINDLANKAVVLRPSLQTLELTIADLGATIGEPTYVIDASNYQEVSGAYFSSTPAAFSPDGKYMALMTRAPNNYDICTVDADCKGVGQHCGPSAAACAAGTCFCTAIENTIHFFDLANLDKLGQNCSNDAGCGGTHECYIPSTSALDKAACIPRRVVLGLPPTPAQPRNNPKSGCENTAGDALRPYTSLAAPMSFGADGSLYVVGQRQCAGLSGELNIPDSDILRLKPNSSKFEVVYGNPGKDFDANKCFNAAENKIDVTECITYINSARLSPNGNEITFLATNPNVTDVSKASTSFDVWTVLLDGTMHEWNGGRDLFDRVEAFWVHPRP